MKFASYLPAAVLMLAACSDWPEIDAPSRANTAGAWPSLVPLDEVTGVPQTGDPQTEARRLSSRAETLRAKARIMRRRVPDQDAFEALRARLAR